MDIVTIGAVATFILCMVQVLFFMFIEPKIQIKLKENDTLKRIRRRKRNCTILIFVLGILTIILLVYGLVNQIPICTYIALFFLIFISTGMSKIYDRIENKEKLFLTGDALSTIRNTSIKDVINIKNEQLRKDIIIDNIEQIGLKICLKTGENYHTKTKEMFLLDLLGKTFQEEILQKNIESIDVEDIGVDKLNLKVKTKNGNTFQRNIEKDELLNYIEVK